MHACDDGRAPQRGHLKQGKEMRPWSRWTWRRRDAGHLVFDAINLATQQAGERCLHKHCVILSALKALEDNDLADEGLVLCPEEDAGGYALVGVADQDLREN